MNNIEIVKNRIVRWAKDTWDNIRLNWRAILLALFIVVLMGIFVVYATLHALNNELAESPFFMVCWGILIGIAVTWMLFRYKVVEAEGSRERLVKICKSKNKELEAVKLERDNANAAVDAATEEVTTYKEALENANAEIQRLTEKLVTPVGRIEASVARLIETLSPSAQADSVADAEESDPAPSEPCQDEPKDNTPDYANVDAILCIFDK